MKKILLLIFSILFANTVFSQTSEKFIVHLKNGQQVEYDMENVEFVEVIASDIADGSAIESVGGTVANAVDLDLSVLWSDHNLGATYPTDCGLPLCWNAEQQSAWGEGWRLPTEEEWQELYDKCKWTWDIYDGIGGRTIYGANGRSIFIPAAGININDQQLSNGSIGIYWTSGNEQEESGDVKAIGTYFDSANIYRIEYPVSNKFSVRLVKDKQ